MLRFYLKRQCPLILTLSLFVAVFAGVLSLYDLPAEAVGYAAVLCGFIGSAVFVGGYCRYARRHRELTRLLQNGKDASFSLPPPNGALEEDYQALLRAVCADRAGIAAAGESAQQEMMDYYTLWAHQIKTPLAAMQLLLTEDPPDRSALSAELLKTEEYVEMVLSYLRLGCDTTDFVLRRCSLDGIIRAALRKYARLFILKKITLQFHETGRTVLTDEKWLGFVVGQLLSNALKYTPEGGTIRIYGDGETLAVADTGIGIREEDLPRVFEKGFTGYNGRAEKKSTGIGLYLCRRILTKLGHELTITSRPGQGTIARLLLHEGKPVVE